jgi:hypothetical protein
LLKKVKDACSSTLSPLAQATLDYVIMHYVFLIGYWSETKEYTACFISIIINTIASLHDQVSLPQMVEQLLEVTHDHL